MMDLIRDWLTVVLLALLLVAAVLTRRFKLLAMTREAEAATAQSDAREALAKAQQQVDQQLAAVAAETDRMRIHYETEVKRVQTESRDAVATLEPFRKYAELHDAEAQMERTLADALNEATALRAEARALLEDSKAEQLRQRTQTSAKAKEIQLQRDSILDRATRDAGRLIEEAHRSAEHIAGDAYTALRDKERLEQAAAAIRNVIEGYGDRYVIPTRSLVDQLASDFGHTTAGHELATAREQSRRMIEEDQAADCDYVEKHRRETAKHFVIDAFNGRVEASLTRSRHDNYGTLEQELRDAFALVNHNGTAFRNARIQPAYLQAKLSELKWAVIAQELKLKEREEQRRIREQMREEEKARREYERARQEAQREEEIILKALDKARLEASQANEGQKAQYSAEIEELNRRLAEAEAKNQRAVSMAQQTRKGNVYVISNVGSFGENVFKIGMTRRLEPLDRIKELGDASVPFYFDIHAIISSDDAPSLENLLHNAFDDLRINRVNFRKEFFRIPLDRLRTFFEEKGISASFTMTAEAAEYRETQAMNKMTPDEREHYQLRRDEHEDGEAD